MLGGVPDDESQCHSLVSQGERSSVAQCPAPAPCSRRVTRLCLCFPREPDKTNLVTFFQTDLSGYLPRSVVDSFFPRSMAGFYANLEKAVRTLYD